MKFVPTEEGKGREVIMPKDLFLVVDGNSLLHRAYHALPPMDFNGQSTNAVHGFLMMLFKVFEQFAPRYCAVAFDEHAPTFRHTMYPEYKAGRSPTPEDLLSQFPLIREILTQMHIKTLSVVGYEADDILGTVARLCGEKDIDALLLTGDRDALQLVKDNTRVLFTCKGISETVLYDAQKVLEDKGVSPDQITDLKGLMGDASDNIPGIPGVGEKTAVKLLQQYKTLENTLAHAGEIKGKLGEKIALNQEQGIFSKDLATIRPTVPIELDWENCRTDRLEDGFPILSQYGLNAVLRQAKKLSGKDFVQKKPQSSLPSAPALVHDQPQIPHLKKPDDEILDTKEKISAFIAETQNEETAFFAGVTEMSIATSSRFGRILPASDLLSVGLTPTEIWTALQPLFERPLVVHDGKSLMHLMNKQGFPLPILSFDTMLAQYLLNPQEKSYALHAFAEENAFGVLDLKARQKALLEDMQMLNLHDRLELPLSYVLYDMEKEGFMVDQSVLEGLGKKYTARAEEIKEQIYSLVGQSNFNLNSPQQLGKVLFETLGLKPGKKTARGYSTDADTLEAIADEHPCIPLILEYRSLVKFNSTYIVALLNKADSSCRVHTSFDQTGTATGRISSLEPNLQNIPVRTDLGREIRKAFIVRPGYLLVDADYSQIELRLLAHMSQDAAMQDAFNKNQDIHTRTAAEVYGVDMEHVTPAMRSAAKAVNFGIVYGISGFGLAKNIGVSRKEATDFINRYFERYPGVKAFMDNAKEIGKEKSYAQTLMGRRRMLNELQSPNAVVRGFGERVAMNMPVQGTAADIIKAAMVQVHQRLKNEYPDARLILQVHDELLIEAPKNQAQSIADMLKETMERVAELSVPLISEVKIGESWFETK